MRTSSPLFDEGFLEEETSREEEVSPIVTTMESSSNDSGISQPSDLKTSIWDAALSFEPSKHYTWETVGKHPGLQELPYLTEAGPEAVDKIFAVKLNEMSILCPSLQEASKVTVSVKQLVNDILQLLIGVPSHLFLLNKEARKFYMKDWICVSGLTPTSVDNLLAPFVESGSIYHQLSLLVQLPVHKITDSGGHTYQAFIQAIDNYLLYYRAAVLSIPKDITLLQLEFYCRRLGLELLDYLYKKTVEMWDSEQYYLMLSIFQRACTPFALYLQNWVFHGVCKDEYGEFMIKVSDNIIQLTGKENWNEGFQLQIPSTANGFFEFLSGMFHDIFTCGQSLNLIRICNPQHFICNVNNNEVPQIRFFHSKNELKSLQQYSQCYFSRLHQIARQTMQARLERKDKLIQMKKDLAAKAQEMAASELKRINTELENIKKLQQEKKKKEFQFLKEQMEEAQLRKLKEKEMRKKADELSEKEESLMKAKAEMEAEIKEKIKRHYADLSEQAALREERALWNVRRVRLNDQRMEFLKAEERKWKTVMEEWKSKQTKELDPNLPQWAKSALTTARTSQEAELHVDPNLPSWARHGDSKPLMTIVDDADREEEKEDSPSLPIAKVLSEEKLPSWAKKGISSVDGVVKDSGIKSVDQQTLTASKPISPPEEQPLVSHRKQVEGHSITKESSATSEVDQVTLHRKQVEDQSISKESDPTSGGDVIIPHKKQVEDQSISKESSATSGGDTIIPHKKQAQVVHRRKSVDNQGIHQQTYDMSPTDLVVHRKKKVPNQSVTQESSESTLNYRHSGIFISPALIGHGYYEFELPVLKQPKDLYAQETDMKDFSIRRQSGVFLSDDLPVVSSSLTSQPPQVKTHNKMSSTMSATTESEPTDDDASKRARFKQRNIHGHSSDSTIQKLLIKLVNKCALDYFLTELSIEEHFSAMWRYLIMGEGDFAFNLTSLLFEKLSMNPHPNEILNPIFLNSIMNQAFKCSISAEDKYIKNLSFEITKDSSSTVKDDAKILECLNLAYKVDWPLNIIINKECHRKYRQLYLFLLQLRYAMWLLEQIWRQLKRDGKYIMREFVKALQNFFVNQVLYISWTNFQKAFHTKVFSLDDLHKLHMDFLDASLKQSLFMSPANHMMAAIKNMFSLILAFYQTLRSHTWHRDKNGGPIKHPNFPRLLKLYEDFCRYSKHFYDVISALAQQNCEPHLQDLVLLLNYNNWFSQR
uniref:Gamma-tubulin complex component n=1 Tax=Octopus bimaculoides TaxID=37653 RepID=A0A0L8GTH3_OCTBM